MKSINSVLIAATLTAYNILVFATNPSLFTWCSALFTVCMLFWLLTVVVDTELSVEGKS